MMPQRLKDVWKSNFWRRIIINVVLLLFTVFGGFTFFYLENEAEEQYLKEKKMAETKAIERRSNQLKEYVKCLGPAFENTSLVYFDAAMQNFSTEKIFNLQNNRRRINPYSWSFWSSVFYSMSIYTTVGFGNIVCDTLAGRIFSIFYAIIGIPLLLFYSAEMGCLLQQGIIKLKSFFRRRAQTRNNKGPLAKIPSVESVEVNTNPLKETSILLIAYMFIGPIVCMQMFGWTYFDSFYFFFMTISTIGFGDIVPTTPERALAASFALMAGLIIFASCINSLVSITGKKDEEIRVFPLSALQMSAPDPLRDISTVSGRDRRKSCPNKI